jgi:hypothetical protein
MNKARRAAATKTRYPSAKKQYGKYWKKYSPEQLIEQLQTLSKRLGRKPTDRDINGASALGECASATTFAREFGGLNAAYRAAGFIDLSKKHRRWSDQEIAASLRKLTRDLGHFPSYQDIDRIAPTGTCPSSSTIVTRLGSLVELRITLEKHR